MVANVKLISNEIHPKVNIWSYAELISRKENFFEMPSFNKTPDWVTYYLFFPLFQEVLNEESKGKLQHMIIVLFRVINCRWGCIKDSRIPESQKIKDSMRSWISGYHGFHELQDFMKQSIPWHQGFYGKRIRWLVWSRMWGDFHARVKVCSAVQDFCETLLLGRSQVETCKRPFREHYPWEEHLQVFGAKHNCIEKLFVK